MGATDGVLRIFSAVYFFLWYFTVLAITAFCIFPDTVSKILLGSAAAFAILLAGLSACIALSERFPLLGTCFRPPIDKWLGIKRPTVVHFDSLSDSENFVDDP